MLVFAALALTTIMIADLPKEAKIWAPALAWEWSKKHDWLVGCNFIPSTAINQLEMWQADTFDPVTIDRELGLAQSIGMNCVRVYLHQLAYLDDEPGLFRRMDQFLEIADKRGIKTMFVLFDDCWNEDAKLGKQPGPKPGVHNSGWLQCPGKTSVLDPKRWGPSESYAKGILKRFAKDKRILAWDLYNEPGNGTGEAAKPFLEAVYKWGWSVRPDQPMTTGSWADIAPLDAVSFAWSDINTGHSYDNLDGLKAKVEKWARLGRPFILTEWMARTNGSKAVSHLPYLKEAKIGCINWGLVSGKTNTIFPWGSKEGSPEPEVWFHDLFRADGTPFDKSETDLFRSLTARG
jgi:hypothetical protein